MRRHDDNSLRATLIIEADNTATSGFFHWHAISRRLALRYAGTQRIKVHYGRVADAKREEPI